MNYIAMIQNRRSVRAFRSKEVSDATLAELRTHYERNCSRLIPELATELVILDADAQSALERARFDRALQTLAAAAEIGAASRHPAAQIDGELPLRRADDADQFSFRFLFTAADALPERYGFRQKRSS